MTTLSDHFHHFIKYRLFSKLLRITIEMLPVKFHTKLIIGAAETGQSGYISTDIDLLDITKASDWRKLFYKNSLTNIVSEHVFEHLDKKQCAVAFELCFQYLKSGGILRIAVPDRYRKDDKYVKEVSPPSDGHKNYFACDELVSMLKKTGFKTKKLEWHDKTGLLHYRAYDDNDGKIYRSIKWDRQKKFYANGHFYTSLIIDAIKP